MSQALELSIEQRHELCQAAVTLNGLPARISSAGNGFAVVREIKTGLGCEWAWTTAARIVAKGGKFSTVEPGRKADRPSCLVVNPRNLDASIARRAKLLAAFDSLTETERADLLETVETIAFRQSAGVDLERDAARQIMRRVYAVAGWEQR